MNTNDQSTDQGYTQGKKFGAATEGTVELFEAASENIGEILDLLDQLSAGMENVVLHLGHLMPKADVTTRGNTAAAARELLTKIGYSNDSEG